MSTNIIAATSLLGREKGSLKNIDFRLLKNNDVCFVVHHNSFYFYKYNHNSTLEEFIPNIVMPGGNPSNGRWLLLTVGSMDTGDVDEHEIFITKYLTGIDGLHIGYSINDLSKIIINEYDVLFNVPITQPEILTNSNFNADLLDTFHANLDNIPYTIPVRDDNGIIYASMFSGTLSGSAESAFRIRTPINITIVGDNLYSSSTTTDFSTDVEIPLTLLPHAYRHISGDDIIYINNLHGIITDDQHGQKTNGSLHSVASNTANGFMSSNDYIMLHDHKNRHHKDGIDPLELSEIGGIITEPQHGFLVSSIETPLHNVATETKNGFMSSNDRLLLNDLNLYINNHSDTHYINGSDELDISKLYGNITAFQHGMLITNRNDGLNYHNLATRDLDGFMSKEDKIILENLSVNISAHSESHYNDGIDPIDISRLHGIITDDQHGQKTNGSLHSVASNTINGFMSSNDYIMLHDHKNRHHKDGIDPLELSEIGGQLTKFQHGFLQVDNDNILHSVASDTLNGFMSSNDYSILYNHKNRHHKDGDDPINIGELSGNLTEGQHGIHVNQDLHSVATIYSHGFMSKDDKILLSSIGEFTSSHKSRHYKDGEDFIDISQLFGNITKEQHGYIISDGENLLHNIASPTQNGFMSKEDKTILDNLSVSIVVHGETHYENGSDEILISGLRGVITDQQHGEKTNQSLHSTADENNNGFMSNIDYIYLYNHKNEHYDGGSDPLDISKLIGTLTQEQHGEISYSDTIKYHGVASQTHDGFMSSSDKIILDTIHTYILVDETNYLVGDKLIYVCSDIQGTEKIRINTTTHSSLVILDNDNLFYGKELYISDLFGTFGVNNVVLKSENYKIEDSHTDHVLNKSGILYKLIFFGDEIGWKIFEIKPSSEEFIGSHDSTFDKNSNPLFQHITQEEKDKFVGYDERINNNTERLEDIDIIYGRLDTIEENHNNLVQRVDNIEDFIFQEKPIISDSNVNNQFDIDFDHLESVGYIFFNVQADSDNVFIDSSKIKFNDDVNITFTPVLIHKEGNNYELRINISGVSSGTTYTITLEEGAVINTYRPSDRLENSFGTMFEASVPFIIQTSSHLSSGINPNDNIILYYYIINYNGNTQIKDSNRVTSNYMNIIDSVILNAVSDENPDESLSVILKNLQYDKEYNITLLSGLIKNNYFSNEEEIMTSITTLPSNVVIEQSQYNNSEIDRSVTYIEYNLKTLSGNPSLGGFELEDNWPLFVTVESGLVTIEDVTINEDKLRIHLGNINNNDTFTIKILPFLVKNNNGNQVYAYNTEEIITNIDIIFKVYVQQSPIHGTYVNKDINVLTFDILDATGNVHIYNLNNITISNGQINNITINNIDKKLNVFIGDIDYSKTYTININQNSINDDNGPNISPLECTFYTYGNIPIINQPENIHENQSVNNTITYVDYPVTSSGNIIFNNINGISMVPNRILNRTVHNIGGNRYIRVHLNSLNFNTTYTINIAINTIINDGTLNNTSVMTTFKTVHDNPVINQTSINNSNIVKSDTLTIDYPINSTGQVLEDDFNNISVTNATISNVDIDGNTLKVTINNINYSTAIGVTIGPNTIKNIDKSNINTISSTLNVNGDVVVIGNSSINTNQSVDKTITYIDFPLTTQNDGPFGDLSITNTAGITMTPNRISNRTIHVDGINRFLRVGLNTLSFNTSYTIDIDENVITNDSTSNTNSITNTFKVEHDNPVINQSTSNNTRINKSDTFVVEYPITSTAQVLEDNFNNISVTNATISNVAIDGNTLKVTINNINYSTNITLNIGANVVKNIDKSNVNIVTTSIIVNGDVIVIGNSSINTNQSVDKSMTYIDFPLTTQNDGPFGDLSITNAAGITMTPNRISNRTIHVDGINRFLRVSLNTLSFNTSYTIDINANVITNDSTSNTNSITNTFKVEHDSPVVNQTSINNTRINKLDELIINYPINSTDTVLEDNFNNISVTNATISNVAIDGNTLKVTINNINYSTTIGVTIGANTIKNSDKSNINIVSSSIIVNGDALVVGDSSINTNQSVDKTITYIDFPLTTQNGGPITNVTINSSLLHCNVVGIIQSSSIIGDVLRININNLLYNTNYTISVLENALTNDGTNINNLITNTFKTRFSDPIININNIVCGEYNNLEDVLLIDFEITSQTQTQIRELNDMVVVSSPSGVDIFDEYVDGNKLNVVLDNVEKGMEISLYIGQDTVYHIDGYNKNYIDCNFFTYGEVPIIGPSTDDGTTEIESTSYIVSFPISIASGGIKYDIIPSNISVSYSSGGNTGTLSHTSGDFGYINDIFMEGNTLKVEIKGMTGSTSYTISCNNDCIRNHETPNTNSVNCVISTKTEEVLLYEWTLEFIMTSSQGIVYMDTVDGYDPVLHNFTIEEMYGETYNCDNEKVNLHFLGYINATTGEWTTQYPDEPETPKSVLIDIGCETRPRRGLSFSLEGTWDYDFDGIPNSIMFSTGTSYTKKYSLRKKI